MRGLVLMDGVRKQRKQAKKTPPKKKNPQRTNKQREGARDRHTELCCGRERQHKKNPREECYSRNHYDKAKIQSHENCVPWRAFGLCFFHQTTFHLKPVCQSELLPPHLTLDAHTNSHRHTTTSAAASFPPFSAPRLSLTNNLPFLWRRIGAPGRSTGSTRNIGPREPTTTTTTSNQQPHSNFQSQQPSTATTSEPATK